MKGLLRRLQRVRYITHASDAKNRTLGMENAWLYGLLANCMRETGKCYVCNRLLNHEEGCVVAKYERC